MLLNSLFAAECGRVMSDTTCLLCIARGQKLLLNLVGSVSVHYLMNRTGCTSSLVYDDSSHTLECDAFFFKMLLVFVF